MQTTGLPFYLDDARPAAKYLALRGDTASWSTKKFTTEIYLPRLCSRRRILLLSLLPPQHGELLKNRLLFSETSVNPLLFAPFADISLCCFRFSPEA